MPYHRLKRSNEDKVNTENIERVFWITADHGALHLGGVHFDPIGVLEYLLDSLYLRQIPDRCRSCMGVDVIYLATSLVVKDNLFIFS